MSELDTHLVSLGLNKANIRAYILLKKRIKKPNQREIRENETRCFFISSYYK